MTWHNHPWMGVPVIWTPLQPLQCFQKLFLTVLPKSLSYSKLWTCKITLCMVYYHFQIQSTKMCDLCPQKGHEFKKMHFCKEKHSKNHYHQVFGRHWTDHYQMMCTVKTISTPSMKVWKVDTHSAHHLQCFDKQTQFVLFIMPVKFRHMCNSSIFSESLTHALTYEICLLKGIMLLLLHDKRV